MTPLVPPLASFLVLLVVTIVAAEGLRRERRVTRYRRSSGLSEREIGR